jgi:hypothetical protein
MGLMRIRLSQRLRDGLMARGDPGYPFIHILTRQDWDKRKGLIRMSFSLSRACWRRAIPNRRRQTRSFGERFLPLNRNHLLDR